MQNNIRECLERAAECARLAECVDHTELKLFLTKLATLWTKVAAEVIETQSHDTDFFAHPLRAKWTGYRHETTEASATIFRIA
jgi:hypothetical protein